MKRYFVTGLLIWVPLGITLWVLDLLIGTLDQSLTLLPVEWQPRQQRIGQALRDQHHRDDQARHRIPGQPGGPVVAQPIGNGVHGGPSLP